MEILGRNNRVCIDRHRRSMRDVTGELGDGTN